MWANIGPNNGAKGEVVGFIYKYEFGPRIINLTEAVFVQVDELYNGIEAFL